jgi:energy-coupling factor transporter ATP-binding protein EcfA2
MNDVRNLLLVGKTGNGKSTLANVLSGTNRFAESSGSVSETRHIQSEIFEVNISRDGRERIRYRVIDTVGIGDTQLTPRGVFYRIGQASHSMQEGLNQILFVTNGRFTQEEARAYRDLKRVIFDGNVGRYTTIVRTNFPDFGDERACERDREAMRRENSEMSDIINSVRRIIYVDNPPVGTNNPRRNAVNQEERNASRDSLLAYLGTCQDTYRPENLHNMNERIGSYVTEQERLEKELKEKEEQMRQQEARMQQELSNLRTQQAQQLQQMQASFQEQMRQANEQRNREIRELEERNRREAGQIREENERRLKQMEEDARRQQEKEQKL